jgi:hypothetical protein
MLFILSLLFFGWIALQAEPYPISFSIPEKKIVKDIPIKTRDFAHIIPGNISTYIYSNEDDYYKGYQSSYFAVTTKKGGWDCLRHYEILANGCIPYFVNIEKCNPKTMVHLPKDLIIEAMNLEGVSYLSIDHAKFDKKKYNEILKKIIEHAKNHLTTKNMARYLLEQINYKGRGNILFLSYDVAPDYLRCLTLIGLKELFPYTVVDFPKIEHIYTNYPKKSHLLYGKGFSYTKIIEDHIIDRNNIEKRIKNKEFDLIIYGSVHRGILFHELVTATYESENIVYLCGEDFDYSDSPCIYKSFNNLFLREFDACRGRIYE